MPTTPPRRTKVTQNVDNPSDVLPETTRRNQSPAAVQTQHGEATAAIIPAISSCRVPASSNTKAPIDPNLNDATALIRAGEGSREIDNSAKPLAADTQIVTPDKIIAQTGKPGGTADTAGKVDHINTEDNAISTTNVNESEASTEILDDEGNNTGGKKADTSVTVSFPASTRTGCRLQPR